MKPITDAGYKLLKPGQAEKKYDTRGLSVKAFDFLEWMSHLENKKINTLLEEAVLGFYPDSYKTYRSYGDEERLRISCYKSHLFKQQPSFDKWGDVIDHGRKKED